VPGMKFLPLVWAGLWRRPARSILTAMCIVVAFLLLGLLDGVNAQLLGELRREPRLTMAELARRVGMSSPAVTERVRRMEEAGVIVGLLLASAMAIAEMRAKLSGVMTSQ